MKKGGELRGRQMLGLEERWKPPACLFHSFRNQFHLVHLLLVGFINQEMDSLETWAHVEKHLTSARSKEGLRT